MVPNDMHQYKGIVQLLLHYRWTWVGIFISNYDNEELFLQKFLPMLSSNYICSAFVKIFPRISYMSTLHQAYYTELQSISAIIKSKVNVFVAYGSLTTMSLLAWYLQKAVLVLPLGKVWIVTSYWDFTLATNHRNWDVQAFQGTISFSVHSNEPPGFRKFQERTNVFTAKNNGLIQDFWEETFNCLLKNYTLGEVQKAKKHCTGEETLESLPGTLFEMSMMGHSYIIYNAVHAIAHALHTMFASRSKYKAQVSGERLVLRNVQPWKVKVLCRLDLST